MSIKETYQLMKEKLLDSFEKFDQKIKNIEE